MLSPVGLSQPQIYLRVVSSSHLHSFKHGNSNGPSCTRNQGPTACCGSSVRYCDPSDRGRSKVLVQGIVNRNSFLVGRLGGARSVGKALLSSRGRCGVGLL